MLKKILLFLAILFASFFVSCENPQKTEAFTGSLVFRDFYGAPNFGENPETDKIEKVPVLVLKEPFEFTEIDGGKIIVSEMQIVPSDYKTNLRQYENQEVKATGEISQAQTGHHHTQAVLFLKKIKNKRH